MTLPKVIPIVCSILLAASQGTICASEAQKEGPPNVVFILADDLGITDVAAFASHFSGKQTEELFYETPHLDKLVGKGIAFSQAYANPLCSPTRASILTGKNAARSGFTTATPNTPTYFKKQLPVPEGHSPHDAIDHKDPIKEQQAWLNGKSNTGLEPSPVNLPNVLGSHQSVFIGKWHVGGGNAEALQPTAHGFDEVLWKKDAGGCAYYVGGKGRKKSNQQQPKEQGPYLTDRLTDLAVDFIDNYGAKEKKGAAQKPFFLYFCHFAVHTPLQAPEETKQLFANKPQKGTLGHENVTYAAMIKHLDDSVGRLMEALEAQGLDQNTLIIFASDNGGAEYTNSTDNAPFKGGKATMYEGGVRVPLVYYLPGKYEGGLWCDSVVSMYDHLPTLTAITGNQTPAGLDGIDLSGLLANPNTPGGDRTIVWHYPYNVKVMHPDHNLPLTPHTGMRKGDFKLLWDWHGKLELYNIVDDPYENTDLSERLPELTTSLFKEMKGWLKANVKPHYMPQPNPDYDAAQDQRPYPFRDLRDNGSF
ncbi:MAG: sulfatase [Coraliomargarita sp.]